MNYLVTGGSDLLVSFSRKLLKDGHFVINIDNFDDFYDYQIKIKNTLESVGLSTDFDFTEKDTDILKLIEKTNSENYKLYYTDIRDKESLNQIFKNHKIDVLCICCFGWRSSFY
jgi:UDP-glucuronate 4-epimerase